jgi:hydrogenase expression/formation protein HypC
MCLGIPGEVTNILDDDSLMKMGKVNFGGIFKEVCLAYLPEVKIGDYVIVHAGFAISIVNSDEAKQIFNYLEEIGEIENQEG